MNKIGIKFSDNDFTCTITGFLRTLADGILCNQRNMKLSRKRIVYLFNQMAESLFYLYQNGWDVEEFLPENYLFIKTSNVFIDGEVDIYVDYLRKTRSENGEFFYLDIELTLNTEMSGLKIEPVIVIV